MHWVHAIPQSTVECGEGGEKFVIVDKHVYVPSRIPSVSSGICPFVLVRVGTTQFCYRIFATSRKQDENKTTIQNRDSREIQLLRNFLIFFSLNSNLRPKKRRTDIIVKRTVTNALLSSLIIYAAYTLL